MQFNLNQLRVIGCLIEKSITTPEQYPLSINALTNACNQKSNREPVLSLSEREVQDTVDELTEKGLIMTQAGATSRVAKYKHRFCNTEFSDLQLSAQELAIICVLFLRGPQTPGELRTRTNRLCNFNNVQETESVLNEMCDSNKGPLVIKLAREPGRRESRYAHCFADVRDLNTAIQETVQSPADTMNENDSILQVNHNERILQLEEKVELMQIEIDELREKLDCVININNQV